MAALTMARVKCKCKSPFFKLPSNINESPIIFTKTHETSLVLYHSIWAIWSLLRAIKFDQHHQQHHRHRRHRQQQQQQQQQQLNHQHHRR